MNATEKQQLIEWGVAGRAFGGQADSGDQHLVEPFADGVLVAVVDGLGHGNRAAAVAKTAVAALKEHADESVIELTQRCHKALRGTRGVVMSLASLRRANGSPRGKMSWLGVGNVEGVLLRANGQKPEARNPKRESLLLRGGVLGYHLPSLRETDVSLSPGDTLVFATDGLRSSFSKGLTLEGTAQEMADRIFAKHSRETDDALVLVARYVDGAG